MNTLVPIEQAKISQRALQRMQQGRAQTNNFSDGIRDAFPLLSIKGKVFRVRVDGEEKALIDPATKQPIPFLDVVLVNAAPMLSKTYYAKGFTDGDMNPPDCWSLDSVRPDASVAQKMAPLCANCPMNQFGSKITDNGKAAKACQDARRVAVVMPGQLDQDQQMMMLLRVPQSSLKNLKNYAQLLARHMMEPGSCVTRLAFDYQEAFPKLLFNFVAPLSDDQCDVVFELADADNTKLMLQAPDFDTSQSHEPLPNATGTMQGMPVQQTPVLADEAAVLSTKPVIPTQGAIPVQTKPAQSSQRPATCIDLPDGKIFDTATSTYWQPDPAVAKAPEPPKVELDPMTIKLPTGQFYNQKLGMFVAGPEVGAAPVIAPAAEPAPKKRAPPKKTEAKAAEPVQQETQAAAEEQQGQAEEVSQQSEGAVKPASRGLEDFLAVLMPPTG